MLITLSGNRFISVLEQAGKDVDIGIKFILKNSAPIETFVSVFFPEVAPETFAAIELLSMLQTAIVAIEQKYAKAGIQRGTGQAKKLEVIKATQSLSFKYLTAMNKPTNTDYQSSIITGLVGIMNAQLVKV